MTGFLEFDNTRISFDPLVGSLFGIPHIWLRQAACKVSTPLDLVWDESGLNRFFTGCFFCVPRSFCERRTVRRNTTDRPSCVVRWRRFGLCTLPLLSVDSTDRPSLNDGPSVVCKLSAGRFGFAFCRYCPSFQRTVHRVSTDRPSFVVAAGQLVFRCSTVVVRRYDGPSVE